MYKQFAAAVAVILSGPAMAHGSHAQGAAHAAEHLLLALFLAPLVPAGIRLLQAVRASRR